MLTVAEVARRTGRTHQAVSQAALRGVSLEDMLARPKGTKRSDAKLPGRKGRFSGEGNTSELVYELADLGIGRDALTRRAERLGSLRAAVAAVQIEILVPMLLQGLGEPERVPGEHYPCRFIRPQVAEIRHEPALPAAARAG